ncbi:hypothetical protein ACTTZI_004189 [Vibrio vulnificus]
MVEEIKVLKIEIIDLECIVYEQLQTRIALFIILSVLIVSAILMISALITLDEFVTFAISIALVWVLYYTIFSNLTNEQQSLIYKERELADLQVVQAQNTVSLI